MQCGSGGDGRREEGGEALKGSRNGKLKVRFEGKKGCGQRWAAYGCGRWEMEIWVRELNMLNGQILAEAASEKWFLTPYEQCCVRGLIFSCPCGTVHCLLNKEHVF